MLERDRDATSNSTHGRIVTRSPALSVCHRANAQVVAGIQTLAGSEQEEVLTGEINADSLQGKRTQNLGGQAIADGEVAQAEIVAAGEEAAIRMAAVLRRGMSELVFSGLQAFRRSLWKAVPPSCPLCISAW